MARVTNDPPQSPFTRGKKKILPPCKGGLGGIEALNRRQNYVDNVALKEREN